MNKELANKAKQVFDKYPKETSILLAGKHFFLKGTSSLAHDHARKRSEKVQEITKQDVEKALKPQQAKAATTKAGTTAKKKTVAKKTTSKAKKAPAKRTSTKAKTSTKPAPAKKAPAKQQETTPEPPDNTEGGQEEN